MYRACSLPGTRSSIGSMSRHNNKKVHQNPCRPRSRRRLEQQSRLGPTTAPPCHTAPEVLLRPNPGPNPHMPSSWMRAPNRRPQKMQTQICQCPSRGLPAAESSFRVGGHQERMSPRQSKPSMLSPCGLPTCQARRGGPVYCPKSGWHGARCPEKGWLIFPEPRHHPCLDAEGRPNWPTMAGTTGRRRPAQLADGPTGR